MELARDGRTADEQLVLVLLAQKINHVMGGMAIMPWDVGNLPDVWMDVFTGMADEMPELQKMAKNQESLGSAWLGRQGYRNYQKR